jgi:hypothetical protein
LIGTKAKQGLICQSTGSLLTKPKLFLMIRSMLISTIPIILTMKNGISELDCQHSFAYWLYLTYTERKDKIRLIRAREAIRQEKDAYEEN